MDYNFNNPFQFPWNAQQYNNASSVPNCFNMNSNSTPNAPFMGPQPRNMQQMGNPGHPFNSQALFSGQRFGGPYPFGMNSLYGNPSGHPSSQFGNNWSFDYQNMCRFNQVPQIQQQQLNEGNVVGNSSIPTLPPSSHVNTDSVPTVPANKQFCDPNDATSVDMSSQIAMKVSSILADKNIGIKKSSELSSIDTDISTDDSFDTTLTDKSNLTTR